MLRTLVCLALIEDWLWFVPIHTRTCLVVSTLWEEMNSDLGCEFLKSGRGRWPE
jgi:hypothetical protein